jgi:hypothetical protein
MNPDSPQYLPMDPTYSGRIANMHQYSLPRYKQPHAHSVSTWVRLTNEALTHPISCCRFNDKDRQRYNTRKLWFNKHQDLFFIVAEDGRFSQKGTWASIPKLPFQDAILSYVKMHQKSDYGLPISVPQGYMAVKVWYTHADVCMHFISALLIVLVHY